MSQIFQKNQKRRILEKLTNNLLGKPTRSMHEVISGIKESISVYKNYAKEVDVLDGVAKDSKGGPGDSELAPSTLYVGGPKPRNPKPIGGISLQPNPINRPMPAPKQPSPVKQQPQPKPIYRYPEPIQPIPIKDGLIKKYGPGIADGSQKQQPIGLGPMPTPVGPVTTLPMPEKPTQPQPKYQPPPGWIPPPRTDPNDPRWIDSGQQKQISDNQYIGWHKLSLTDATVKLEELMNSLAQRFQKPGEPPVSWRSFLDNSEGNLQSQLTSEERAQIAQANEVISTHPQNYKYSIPEQPTIGKNPFPGMPLQPKIPVVSTLPGKYLGKSPKIEWGGAPKGTPAPTEQLSPGAIGWFWDNNRKMWAPNYQRYPS